jgi:peroxiredoxin
VRERYDEVRAAGGEVVAVGTGDVRYAAAFVAEERVPFPVVVDDDGAAARLVGAGRMTPRGLVAALPGSRRAWRAGHRLHRSGRRVTQLGATLVVGPGDVVRYAHLDRHTADHAPLDDVLAALREAAA